MVKDDENSCIIDPALQKKKEGGGDFTEKQ